MSILSKLSAINLFEYRKTERQNSFEIIFIFKINK